MSGGNITGLSEQVGNIRSAFRDTLALFVGPGRRFTVEAVSAATGIGQDAIRSYLRGATCPEWHNAVRLLAVLPPEFASAALLPAGLTGFNRIAGDIAPAEALREVAEGCAALAAALADGRIDHTEIPTLRRELNDALVAIAQFLKQMGDA